jgi:hypothetical protein
MDVFRVLCYKEAVAKVAKKRAKSRYSGSQRCELHVTEGRKGCLLYIDAMVTFFGACVRDGVPAYE